VVYYKKVRGNRVACEEGKEEAESGEDA